MINDELYTLIKDKLLLAPDIGIKAVDWYNGQPVRWEHSEGVDADGLILPCALIRLETQAWFGTGHTKYMCDAVVYIDIVQQMVHNRLASDAGATEVLDSRASYDLVHRVMRRLVRTSASPTIGMFQMSMCAQDHDFNRLRVDTIAYRMWLKTDIDPRTYTYASPPVVIEPYINQVPVHGDFSSDFSNDFNIQ